MIVLSLRDVVGLMITQMVPKEVVVEEHRIKAQLDQLMTISLKMLYIAEMISTCVFLRKVHQIIQLDSKPTQLW